MPLYPVGKFKINESQKLRDKGLLIIGERVEGSISVNDYISFNDGATQETLKILGIEDFITVSGVHLTGLIFQYNSFEDQKKYESLKLTLQMAEVSAYLT